MMMSEGANDHPSPPVADRKVAKIIDDSDEESEYDHDDPFSKIFKEGAIVIFDDLDNKCQWHVGEVQNVNHDSVDLQYYDAKNFRKTKTRQRLTLKPAWHDPLDGKDSYATTKPKQHYEPYMTNVEWEKYFTALETQLSYSPLIPTSI
jgi:hypothetical protein